MNNRYLFIQERFKKLGKIARREQRIRAEEEYQERKLIEEETRIRNDNFRRGIEELERYEDESFSVGYQGFQEDEYIIYDEDENKILVDEFYIINRNRKVKLKFEIQSGVPP